jgi:type IV pilus assembly protein PilA
MNRLINRMRHRLSGEEGFTLIELLVVIVIIGILLAIAVPSYLGFRGKAQDATAQSNVREAVPAAEAYYSSNGNYLFNTLANGTATTSAWSALQSYDSGLAPSGSGSGQITVESVGTTGTNYCIYSTGQTGHTWYYCGPGGTVEDTTVPTGC